MGSAAFRVYDWFYKEHYIEKHFAVKKFAGSARECALAGRRDSRFVVKRNAINLRAETLKT